jgi:hypothetical protein
MALTHTAVIGAVALLFGACASSVSVAPQMTRAKSTVTAAEAVGAEQHPRAALHLKMAKDQLMLAEQRLSRGDAHLVDEEESVSVIWLLERAQADAELALALAQSGEAKEQAHEASTRIRQLQLEIE